MKHTRKGLGLGKGRGYYNLVPKDPYIHSLSAKGVKTQRLKVKKTLSGKSVSVWWCPCGFGDIKKEFLKHIKTCEVYKEHIKRDEEFKKSLGLNAKDFDEQTFKSHLSQFTGTEKYHRVSITPVLVTDGVKYLCDNAQSYWLIDAIGSYQINKKIKEKPFQVWIFKKNNKGGGTLLGYEDYSEKNPNQFKPFVKQEIKYTDFPLQEIKLYLTDGIILLPSEY